jgi:hypothetical protein
LKDHNATLLTNNKDQFSPHQLPLPHRQLQVLRQREVHLEANQNQIKNFFLTEIPKQVGRT